MKKELDYSVDNRIQRGFMVNRVKSVPRWQNYDNLGNFGGKLAMICAIQLKKRPLRQRIRYQA